MDENNLDIFTVVYIPQKRIYKAVCNNHTIDIIQMKNNFEIYIDGKRKYKFNSKENYPYKAKMNAVLFAKNKAISLCN